MSQVVTDRCDAASVRRRRQETLVAWRHFVGGDDEAAVNTVPAPVLRSWYRCRDTHNVDPVAPTTRMRGTAAATARRHDLIHALLGELAREIVDGVGNCLATVTDSDAHIRACVTAPELRLHAAQGHLDPDSLWPESCYGTNGMGTALLQPQPVLVRGPEHWRQDMHEWTCLGVAVYDPATDLPVGSINVSSHSETRIAELGARLDSALDPARTQLARNAFVDAVTVAERYSREAAERPCSLLGLDVAGNIIAASEDVRRRIRGVPPGYLLDPGTRRGRSCPSLRRIVAESARCVARDPTWTGTAIIGRPLGERDVYAIAPVRGVTGIAGWIVAGSGSTAAVDSAALDSAALDSAALDSAALDSAALDSAAPDSAAPDSAAPDSAARWVPEAAEDPSGRVAAVVGDSVLLLDPREIRFAESSRHVVWLVTDRGRVRAAVRGMANVERELAPYGFIRVHRSFLVNPERVGRIHRKGHGILALSTDDEQPERIPVSRHCTDLVRRRLGLRAVPPGR